MITASDSIVRQYTAAYLEINGFDLNQYRALQVLNLLIDEYDCSTLPTSVILADAYADGMITSGEYDALYEVAQ